MTENQQQEMKTQIEQEGIICKINLLIMIPSNISII